MPKSNPYRMRLELNVLNHLGLRLYSNVAAVISEAVANSWDADSPSVDISIDTRGDVIQIVDQGHGMSLDEANARFLTVGYDKREEEGPSSPHGRLHMGRKGIGKLALFSVAETVSVASAKNGRVHGFTMSVPAIEQAIQSGKDYYPEPIPAKSLPRLKKGTWIRLSDLKKRAQSQTVAALRKRIARRFSVFGPEFRVTINEIPISPADRDDLSRCQFLWLFKGTPMPGGSSYEPRRYAELPSTVRVGPRSYSVRGWIGSAQLPRHLETPDAGNLNSIVVMARGRLIQENVLDRINIGGLFTKYLTGQIEADFLDLDDGDDIATSDRQRIIEDDPRYQALLRFLLDRLNDIEPMWAQFRTDLGVEEATDLYPRIAEWIEALPPRTRADARRVIGSIQGLAVDEDRRKELLRHGLMAFERLRLSESTDRLAKLVEVRSGDLLPVIGDQDQLEAALYLDVVRARLQVITQFMNLVDHNEKEKVLQTFIFERLWLLDPSWERAAGSERMEQTVQREFEKIDAKLSQSERRGRLDIKYRTMAGKHVIIELKRYGVRPSVFDLAKQGQKYRETTRKLLDRAGRKGEPIDIIFVVGRDVSEEDPTAAEKVMAAINGRVITYDALIDRAIQSYKEFIGKRKQVDAIESLLESGPAAKPVPRLPAPRAAKAELRAQARLSKAYNEQRDMVVKNSRGNDTMVTDEGTEPEPGPRKFRDELRRLIKDLDSADKVNASRNRKIEVLLKEALGFGVAVKSISAGKQIGNRIGEIGNRRDKPQHAMVIVAPHIVPKTLEFACQYVASHYQSIMVVQRTVTPDIVYMVHRSGYVPPKLVAAAFPGMKFVKMDA